MAASFRGSADYAATGSTPLTFTINQATPTVSVTCAGGQYHGKACPATARVIGVNGIAAASLEMVAPTLTYYAGGGTGGTCLSAAPSCPGTYTVVASFAGSADYAPAGSWPVAFQIKQATPTIQVTAIGRTYSGRPWWRRQRSPGMVPGVDTVSSGSLEGVGLTLTYYAGLPAAGTPLPGPPSAAGSYTVVASFAGSTNYGPVQSLPRHFSIKPATPVIRLAAAEGKVHGPSAAGQGNHRRRGTGHGYEALGQPGGRGADADVLRRPRGRRPAAARPADRRGHVHGPCFVCRQRGLRGGPEHSGYVLDQFRVEEIGPRDVPGRRAA